MTDNAQMPFSAEAEEALIGAVMIDPGVFDEIDITSSDFYIERHQWIWSAMAKLHAKRINPDYLTVSEELNKNGRLKDLGGHSALAALLNRVPSSLNVKQYAGIVKNKSKRRKTILLAGDLAMAAYDENGNLDEQIGRVTLKLTETTKTKRDMVHISEVVTEVIDYVEERAKNPNEVYGIPTGFIDLDRISGGVVGTWFIAGEPGIGKSIFMLQVLINAAKKGHWGAIFSPEMSRLALGLRSISSIAETPTRALKTGYMSDEDWTAFYGAVQEVADLPLFICDEPELNTQQFRSHMTRLKAKGQIDLYALDYLYLMTDEEKLESTARTELLSKRVVSIAKSLDIPGITINSVTKEGMDGKPAKSTNIRGSGQLIHDADAVLFILKNEYYDNMRTIEITKGRDFEQLDKIDIVKTGSWPSFKDATAREINEELIP